ncbi:envelope glycoprotein L [Ateline alphaherpesvirus 1]|uniref:Envelope glycoprotein L n=1 Tax=Herpesvirus ateles type 1 (strain Lennette) TaxID=35243 RepID=A0A1S6JLQ8_HSVA1|nr:envelope glycoprotein L [Ateline alphaherpesvirus 1]AQS79215.1 envelope glycoprotein L [Ateline alphaherpesvirus 1]
MSPRRDPRLWARVVVAVVVWVGAVVPHRPRAELRIEESVIPTAPATRVAHPRGGGPAPARTGPGPARGGSERPVSAPSPPPRHEPPPPRATEYAIGSVAAKTPLDVLRTPCMSLPPSDTAWRYAPPERFDYQNVDGVFMRYHCPGMDTVLWDRTRQRAYWVNPFQFLFGLTADVSYARYPLTSAETAAREALYKELSGLYGGRHTAPNRSPVGPGCVNFEYSRTRQCFGLRRRGRANPPTAAEDEAPGLPRRPAGALPANATEPAVPAKGRRRGKRPKKNGRGGGARRPREPER